MGQKKATNAMNATERIEMRCTATEKRVFREAAEREGFGKNLSAWMLWHLRRAAKKSR